MKTWFVTNRLIRGKKKREFWLTRLGDDIDGDSMVVISDMLLYLDSVELGMRVARGFDELETDC